MVKSFRVFYEIIKKINIDLNFFYNNLLLNIYNFIKNSKKFNHSNYYKNILIFKYIQNHYYAGDYIFTNKTNKSLI